MVVGILLLVLREIRAGLHDQPPRIDKPATLPGLLCWQALLDQGSRDHVGDTDAGLTGPQEQKRLVLELAARQAGRRIQAGQCDRPCPLNVVIEGADPVPVLLQQSEGISVGEVLELDHRPGEHLLDRHDKLLHQLVIELAPDSRLPQTHVEGIIQQTLIVRAHIHGQ